MTRKRVLKKLILAAASRGLRYLGVNGLVASVAAHLFWRFIGVPIVKYAHKKRRLAYHEGSFFVKKHGKVWHNLRCGTDSPIGPVEPGIRGGRSACYSGATEPKSNSVKKTPRSGGH